MHKHVEQRCLQEASTSSRSSRAWGSVQRVLVFVRLTIPRQGDFQISCGWALLQWGLGLQCGEEPVCRQNHFLLVVQGGTDGTNSSICVTLSAGECASEFACIRLRVHMIPTHTIDANTAPTCCMYSFPTRKINLEGAHIAASCILRQEC